MTEDNQPRISNLERRNVLGRRSFLGAAALGLGGAMAQTGDFPRGPVKVIVPFPPGGNTDQIARLLSRSLAADLGQNVVIENRAGAGGNIGVDAVAKAPPDGYTLAYSTLSTYALNAGLYAKLPFDPVKDLAPIALTVQVPLVLVVPASSPAASLADLIRQLKAQPGQQSYASAGNGTSGHIACHLFTRLAGVDVQHVPYKGTGPAMTDVMAGRVAFTFDAPSVVAPLIKGGRLRGLAVAVPQRMPVLPEVPTFDESGLRGLRAYSWNAFWAPAATPSAVLDRLHRAAGAAMSDAANQKAIEESGVVAFARMSRAETEAFMRTEYDYWVPQVRAMGVRLE